MKLLLAKAQRYHRGHRENPENTEEATTAVKE